MRLQNSGHNCIAGQVVLMSAEWPQRDAFLAALRTAYDAAPRRSAWYPRTDEKLAAAASDYPDATWCAEGTRALVEVARGRRRPRPRDDGVLRAGARRGIAARQRSGVPRRRGRARQRPAQRHSRRERAHRSCDADGAGRGLRAAIADLRYGSIAINAWTAFGY